MGENKIHVPNHQPVKIPGGIEWRKNHDLFPLYFEALPIKKPTGSDRPERGLI
jgi:hypothetical protein